MPSQPQFAIGSCVEYIGEDMPEIQVWSGHPGRVVDTPPFDPEEAGVSLVGGPSICFGVGDLRTLDAETYRTRGERVIAGMHPLDERKVDSPITAEGSHWP
jgi:hypothetical protein